MATENTDDARENEIVQNTATPEPKPETPQREAKEVKDLDSAKKGIRETIKSAIKEHAPPKVGRPRADAEPKGDIESAPKGVAPESKVEHPKEAKETPSKDDGKAKEAALEVAPVAAPAALSKDLRAKWDQLDPAVRNEFVRLEAESAKGVEKLRKQYSAYDEALTPVRDELRSIGKSEAEAIKMLVDWRKALSGPQKAQAFRALAQAEGINLQQLAPQSPGAPQQTNQPNQNDPSAILRPHLAPISQEVAQIRAELARRDSERVQNDIQSFAKDKPHFEDVKVLMGHLMNSGQATGANPKEAFDRAYEMACRASPDVFAKIQQEAEEKRQSEAKTAQEAKAKADAEAETERKRKEAEAVDKARRAAVGPRGSSPAGMATAKKPGSSSVGESLRAAIKEVRATI